MVRPQITVVVPFYNAEETIGDCLESILEQSHLPRETILVDNGSSDRSVAIVEEFIRKHGDKNIQLVSEKKQGPAAARNRGLAEARADIVAFTDADCVAHRDWLKNMVACYEEGIGGVAGNIYGYKPRNIIEKFLSLFTLRGLPSSKTFSSFNILEGGFSTANLSFRRSLMERIGGFAGEMIRWGEDHDACARVMELGYKLCYTDKAIVYHRHRSSLAGLIKQSFSFGKAHAYLLRKHGRGRFILELPRFTLQSSKSPVRAWINLNLLDKKIVLLILLGWLYMPLFSLLVIYLGYLTFSMGRKCLSSGVKLSAMERFAMVGLLILKSAAMTCGRICASFKHGVVCF